MSEGSTEVDQLLDILGNDTRRRILEILADEPRYFIQLSKQLGVSQQAVLKHLGLLEEAGLIASFRAKSDLAAPDRKYYRLNRSLYLTVGITGDIVELDLTEIGEKEIGESNEWIRRFRDKAEELAQESEPASTIQGVESLLGEIDGRVSRLEHEKVALLVIRQEVMQTAHQSIRNSLAEQLHRRIMYEMLGKRSMSVDELAEVLNAREKEIRNALQVIGGRFSIRLTP